MSNGTSQGSILSPYLFLYIFDVLVIQYAQIIHVGCYIGSMACNILLHADDIVLLSLTWHAQQTLLDLCCSVVNSLVMKFNTIKSVTLRFVPYKSKWRVDYSFPSFTLDECELSVVNKCKYLGHFLCVEDDDNGHFVSKRFTVCTD